MISPRREKKKETPRVTASLFFVRGNTNPAQPMPPTDSNISARKTSGAAPRKIPAGETPDFTGKAYQTRST